MRTSGLSGESCLGTMDAVGAVNIGGATGTVHAGGAVSTGGAPGTEDAIGAGDCLASMSKSRRIWLCLAIDACSFSGQL